MKKAIMIILSIICVSGLFGCSKSKTEPCVVNTFEETSEELIDAYSENSKVIITTKYYEMSDGTWKTDEHTYKYRLEVTGRLRNAARDSTFVILSNIENITFEQAWKASGLSSSMSDYFKAEDAVIVGIS